MLMPSHLTTTTLLPFKMNLATIEAKRPIKWPRPSITTGYNKKGKWLSFLSKARKIYAQVNRGYFIDCIEHEIKKLNFVWTGKFTYFWAESWHCDSTTQIPRGKGRRQLTCLLDSQSVPRLFSQCFLVTLFPNKNTVASVYVADNFQTFEDGKCRKWRQNSNTHKLIRA